MLKGWIDKREKPSDCFTACDFCHNHIGESRKGIMLSIAKFFHWDCLLKLRNEINQLEKNLKRRNSNE